ncbi:hypothetical protein HZ994_05050 [Akkermansiaceae bacterium]|nr:hypothetical protein HZ994_05050 [Akkermansiaceae bacterium]
MRKTWQFPMIAIFALGSTLARAEEKKFDWQPLEIKVSAFSPELVMLNTERDEYATNLAAYAANRIVAEKASAASTGQARRIIALALHLSPRNRQAVVTQFQLAKGIMPEKTEADYSPQVLARLLLTRGQLLLQQAEGENTLLGHFLITLAAEIDPHNEDAVYASELIRIDHGTPDWKTLTDPGKNNEAEPSNRQQP